jgi:hypothetical protein
MEHCLVINNIPMWQGTKGDAQKYDFGELF